MEKLFLFISFFSAFSLLAQTNLDRLWQTSFAMRDDTSKVTALRALSQEYQGRSVDTSIMLAEKALALAKQLGDEKQEYLCWKNGRDVLHAQAKLEEAKHWGQKSLQLSYQYGELTDRAGILSDMGQSCWRLGQIDSALFYYQKSEKLFLKSGEPFWKVNANIGRLYKKEGELEKAAVYFDKAAAVAEQADSRMDFGYIMYMLGEIYLMQSDFEHFDEITDRWEAFKKEHPSTIKYEDRAEHVQAISLFFENIENGEAKLREGIAYEQQVGNDYRVGNYQLTLGRILVKENRLVAAKQVFLEATELQQKNSYVQEKKETFYELFKINKQLNEPKEALAWFEKYQSLSDSLQKEEVLENFAELEVKYQTEKKEQALILKSLETKRAILERDLLSVGLALFGLLAFGFFYYYKKRTETKQIVAKHLAQLQTEKIERLEQEQKVLSLNAMIEGQEQERQRIANDLHDSLGGLLTSVKLHFNTINGGTQNQPVYQKTNTLIDDACVEVRRISHNMMPRALALSGLKSALDDLLQGLEKNGLQTELEVDELSSKLPSTTTIMLYRIIQELTNNIIKHAEASTILIQIFQSGDQLSVLVEDDGKGFDVEKAFQQKGLGLASVESRVRFLQGRIHWDAVKDEGTAVNINIPV